MGEGESVKVQVVAFNSYGESELSVVGSGAFITTLPQAPLNLSSSEVIVGKPFTLSWDVPENNGGAPIIDYTIYEYKNGDFVVLESGIPDNSFDFS